MAENTDTILWEYDLVADRETYVAPQVEHILRYKPQDGTNLRFGLITFMRMTGAGHHNFEPILSLREKRTVFDYPFVIRDGWIVWLSDVVSVAMEKVNTVRLCGFMLNISARKQAKQEKAKLMAQLSQSQKNGVGRLAGRWDCP